MHIMVHVSVISCYVWYGWFIGSLRLKNYNKSLKSNDLSCHDATHGIILLMAYIMYLFGPTASLLEKTILKIIS